MKLFKIMFLSLLFILGLNIQANAFEPFIRMDDSVPENIKEYVKALIDGVNKLHPQADKHYVFYAANFAKEQSIPAAQKNGQVHNIIWLGGYHTITVQNMENYDYVLTTTPMLKDYLKERGIHAYYLPIFGFQNSPSDNKYKYVAVIGNPAFVADELIKRRIFYRQYQESELDKIRRDMPKFKAVFIDDSEYSAESLNIAPIFLDMALMNIPLVTQFNYQYPALPENITLLNDTINYYKYQKDLDLLFDTFFNQKVNDALLKQINNAHNFVEQYFSINANVKTLDYILANDKEPIKEVAVNTLDINLPVTVGDTISGDYWLAYDLNDAFHQSLWQTSISFFNSFFIRPAEVSILVSGFLPKFYNFSERKFTGKYNIIYVAYSLFPYSENANNTRDGFENIPDKEIYLAQLEKLYHDDDVDALVLASKPLTEELNARGIKAYYVPQFTNPKRFYPDYDEDKKSEVFFVGTNSFYRKAAPAALNAGLPITIYGPKWNGAAKEDYLDNRILRQYYSSAKIVLNDTRDGMKNYGFVSNRIYDASATGALVISDYMPEIEEVYGDSVPMWKTEEELIELVKYYLNPEHEAERKEKAERARQITLNNFTVDIAARKFQEIIKEMKKEKGR